MFTYRVPLSRPDISKDEQEAVLDVLKTPYLSLGPKLDQFEKDITNYIGVKYAVGVNSGTSALHLIVRAAGIRDGDEVITTPFSFIASSNCILFERAKPVFVDIDPDTLNIDPGKIEEKITKKTKAILAVDVFGHPADWDLLKRIAKKHKLFLIEDSAEALGSEFKGRKCGSFGEAGVLAFYPNKQITTGEGGMILTNNKNIARLCRLMRSQGVERKDRWLEHKTLGYNYRLNEMSCAMGIVQLRRMGKMLKKRNSVALAYDSKLKNIDGLELPYTAPNVRVNKFVYVVRLSEKYSQRGRDEILTQMQGRGVQCSNYFPSIHLQPLYRKLFGYKKGGFPVCESVSQRTIALPFYNNLKESDMDYVVKNLRELIKNHK